jgi:hypothetical protein
VSEERGGAFELRPHRVVRSDDAQGHRASGEQRDDRGSNDESWAAALGARPRCGGGFLAGLEMGC